MEEELQRQLQEKTEELLEFQRYSKDYEAELEQEVKRCETELAQQQQHKVQLEAELDAWKSKYKELDAERNEQLMRQQETLRNVEQASLATQQRVRELETQNDELEQGKRVDAMSHQQLESLYHQLLEKHALMESELEMRRKMDVDMQRLRDELQDASNEISVLQQQQQQHRQEQQPSHPLSASSSGMPNRTDLVPISGLGEAVGATLQSMDQRLSNCRGFLRQLT